MNKVYTTRHFQFQFDLTHGKYDRIRTNTKFEKMGKTLNTDEGKQTNDKNWMNFLPLIHS